jgi:sugar phosphate isomerase/epimerase
MVLVAEKAPMLQFATKFVPKAATLEAAYRAGFRYAELWLDDVLLADWQAVGRRARDYPFGYALHFPNRPDPTPQTLDHAVALYRHLGCRCLVIHQPLFDRCQAALLQREPGLGLAVENHKLSLPAFADWAEHNPGLALDVEHFWKYTLHDAALGDLLGQLRQFLARHGGKVRHVHLPGYWPGFAEHRPLYCAREMAFPVLSLLAEFHCEGLIVCEVNPEFQNAQELRMDVLLFDAWRERHDPLHRGAEGVG